MVPLASIYVSTLIGFTGFLGAASWVILLPPVQTTRSLCRFSAASSVCDDVLPGSALSGDDLLQQLNRLEPLGLGKNSDAFVGKMRDLTATGTLEGAYKAEELLLQMERDNSPILTNKHYTIVLDAYGRAGGTSKAEEIFQRMKVGSSHNSAVAPSSVTVNVLLHAYALQNDDASALALLSVTKEEGIIKLRTVDYNVVMGILARQANGDGVQSLLSQMRSMDQVKPNIHSYNILLEALGKKSRGQQQQQSHVEMLAVLDLLKQETLSANADTYAHIIQAMAVSCGSNKNCKILADQAQTLFQEALENEVEPSASLILGMMNIYANLPDSAIRVESLLRQYNDLLTESPRADNSSPTRPVAITVAYNTLLKAWKNSSTLQQLNKALDESEHILDLLKAQGLADTISYTTYLGTLATVVSTSADQKGRQKTLALKANQILKDMTKGKDDPSNNNIQPTTLTYNSVLHSWSASGNMARAEQLLLDMEQNNHNDGIYPTIASYTTLMSGWAKLGAQNDSGDHLKEMQNLFDRAVNRYENGNQECKPNQIAYSILIHAYAKTKNSKSAEKAEQLLRRMYQEYMESAASSSPGRSADTSSAVMPNTQLVTAVMDCWRQSGASDAGQRAEDLLNWMVKLSDETGETAMRPNDRSFSSAIAAWARTRAPAKAQRARQLLVKMSNMHRDANIESGPNVYCFTNVINCCAYCIQEDAEKKIALAIAIQTYKELLKSTTLSPTHVTFSAFLTALRNLFPIGRERTNAVQTVFGTAVKMGQVDPLVLKKVQAAISREDFVKLMPPKSVGKDGEIISAMIPSEWGRCVS